MRRVFSDAAAFAAVGALIGIAVSVGFAGGASPAAAQLTAKAPDLVPIPVRLVNNGVVSVRNAGSAPAGAFIVTVQCQKQGDGGCADHPSLRRFESPKYPGRLVLTVNGLQTGHVYNFNLPFWNELVWAPGSYNLLIEVDPAKTVAETNESNNIAGAVFSP